AAVTAAASQAGLISPGTQPRADLDTAQSALAHALRDLRAGEGRSAVERRSHFEPDPAPPPTLEEGRERLTGWQTSVDKMTSGEWHAFVERAAAAEDAIGEQGQPAAAGAGQPHTG